MACLTQTEVDKIWDHVAKLCGICFPPYGSTYVTAEFQFLSCIVTSSGARLAPNTGGCILAYNANFPATEEIKYLQTDGCDDILLDNGNNMAKD